jgi:hypothetical protein
MPLLNSRGDVLAGVAGVQGSLNGVPFPFQTFGGGCWLDDDTVLLSIPAPPPTNALLATWRPGEAQPTPLPDMRGANDFAAGGGRYIAWLAGYGCFGSLGPNPAAGLPGSGTPRAALCVAPDGTIGFIPSRGYGYGLQLVDPSGLVHDITDIYAGAEQTIEAGAAIWTGGAYGIPAPVPACPDAQNLVLAELPDGEVWLVYWSSSVGFIAQLDGSAYGYILGTTPTFFNHHARAVNGELLVTWSVTAGEAPSDVQRVFIDRTESRDELVPLPPDVEEPPPSTEPPDVEEPPPSTEPPDPEPEPPKPEPAPPKGPVMLFIETKYEKTNPTLEVMKFEVIANADGTESYKSVKRAASTDATEKANPIYCVTDQGKDEWRANPGGTFESFRRVGTTLVADRPWNGEENAYVRFCVEVA